MQDNPNPISSKKLLGGISKINLFSLVLVFFAYAWFISVQNLFLPGVSLDLLQTTASVLAYGEHLIFAVIIVSVLLLLRYLKIPLLVLIFISFLAGAVLIIDRMFYAFFYNHLTFSAIEAGTNITQLWGSFYEDMRFIDFFNVFALLIIQIPITRLLSRSGTTKQLNDNAVKPVKLYVKFILASVLLSPVVIFYFLATENLHQNPHLRLAMEYVQTKQSALSTQLLQDDGLALEDYYKPMYGGQTAEDKINTDLSGLISKPVMNVQKKNIILIVLESVGGLQLFPEGKVDKKITPFLASIREKTTLFNSIYTYYPATTRSHVPLQTGGRSITYSTTRILKYPYRGSTLASALKQDQYNTSLVSAQGLNFGNLDVFYKQMGFDLYFDPTSKGKVFQDRYNVHSWGVFETAIIPIAMWWIDKMAPSNKPFLLEFLTVSSHHPYGYPGSKKERNDLSRTERYVKTLRYTDDVIKKLWNELNKRGLLDNSIVYITGDHGQAFGKRHEKNFTHRNYIYEENVVSFLMRIDNAQTKEVTIDRPGSIGDIMPTILADAASTKIPDEVVGQNLFSRNYEPRLQLFHKHQIPRQWGIRDGKWKFISAQINTDNAELYDLSKDRVEKNNLADKYPVRIKEYQERAARWTSAMQHAYESFSRADNPLLSLNAAELAKKGPKKLLLGINPSFLFTQQDTFHPDEDIAALIYRIPDGNPYQYNFTWISPTAKKIVHKTDIEIDSERIFNDLNSPDSMEEGEWQLLVKTGEGLSFSQTFMVSAEAKLRDPRFRAMGPRKVDFYYLDKNYQLQSQASFNPKEQIVMKTNGLPFSQDTKLDIHWISPDNHILKQTYISPARKPTLRIKFNNPFRLQVGEWKVKIYNGELLLTEADFTIDQAAALHKRKKISQRRGSSKTK